MIEDKLVITYLAPFGSALAGRSKTDDQLAIFFMQAEHSWRRPMLTSRKARAIFAITMISLGIIGLLRRDFVPVWNPQPKLPGSGLLVSLASLISLVAGTGILIRNTSVAASRLFFATFLTWLLILLPNFFLLPLFAACWSIFPLIVMLAAAWVIYIRLASDWDRRHIGFMIGSTALRIARAFYGLSLLFFGAAHFIDLKDTLALIPNWLPGHLFWAYFTGCTFIVAGMAILTSLCARLAVNLSVLQIASFLVLVWVPIVAAGSRNSFQWSETILNMALLAGAWVIADSYADIKWLAIGGRQKE